MYKKTMAPTLSKSLRIPSVTDAVYCTVTFILLRGTGGPGHPFQTAVYAVDLFILWRIKG